MTDGESGGRTCFQRPMVVCERLARLKINTLDDGIMYSRCAECFIEDIFDKQIVLQRDKDCTYLYACLYQMTWTAARPPLRKALYLASQRISGPL
jgi:hypothetical protein